MKLIKENYSIVPQKSGINGAHEKIREITGKTVSEIIEINKLYLLEHGEIYLFIKDPEITKKYMDNPYSYIHEVRKSTRAGFYITTDLRVILENNWEDDLIWLCADPKRYHQRRITVKFTLSRDTVLDYIKNREMSIAYFEDVEGYIGDGLTDKEVDFIAQSEKLKITLGIKAESLIMTGFQSSWKNFIESKDSCLFLEPLKELLIKKNLYGF